MPMLNILEYLGQKRHAFLGQNTDLANKSGNRAADRLRQTKYVVSIKVVQIPCVRAATEAKEEQFISRSPVVCYETECLPYVFS